MSNTIAIPMRRSNHQLRQFHPSHKQFAVGPVSLTFITILLGFVLSLFYLTQSNKIATRGYEISGLQTTKTHLLADRDRLQVEAARLQSIESIKATVTKDGKMVPVTGAVYLDSNQAPASK